MRLQPFGGGGEDWPIYGMRLQRDGWTLVQEGGVHKVGGEYEWELDPPLVYEKRGLRMIVRGIGNKNGPGTPSTARSPAGAGCRRRAGPTGTTTAISCGRATARSIATTARSSI
jgi:hypothetical protein